MAVFSVALPATDPAPRADLVLFADPASTIIGFQISSEGHKASGCRGGASPSHQRSPIDDYFSSSSPVHDSTSLSRPVFSSYTKPRTASL